MKKVIDLYDNLGVVWAFIDNSDDIPNIYLMVSRLDPSLMELFELVRKNNPSIVGNREKYEFVNVGLFDLELRALRSRINVGRLTMANQKNYILKQAKAIYG